MNLLLPPASSGAAPGTPPAPGEPRSLQVFHEWARWRQEGEYRPLSAESVAKYEAIWTRWLKHLASCGPRGEACPWHAATPPVVHAFLDALQPRGKRSTHTSNVTRTRYLRTLREVYAHAARMGWIEASPIDGAPPGATSEHSASTVLVGSHWLAVWTRLPQGNGWQASRDRAMLLMMMDALLTVEELRQLRVDQVLGLPREVIKAFAALGLAATAPRARLALLVDGPRRGQRRHLVLSQGTSDALRGWMHWRVRRHLDEPWVFVSKGRPAVARRGTPADHSHQLGPRAVWHCASKVVAQPGTEVPAHTGPMLLRNSAIVAALNAGESPFEVARRAGLTRLGSLRRLVDHCSLDAAEGLRAAWAGEAADDDEVQEGLL